MIIMKRFYSMHLGGNGINSLKGIQKINKNILRPGCDFSKKELTRICAIK